VSGGIRRPLTALALIVAILALPAVGRGQDPAPTPRGERIIEALLIWRLVDELDLSEGQITRIFPRIKALKAIRLEMGRRIRPLIRELRRLNAATPRDDDALRAKVAELNALRAQTEARRRQQLDLIAQVLTTEQLGKFALIQETFEADTLRLLEDARRLIEEPQPRR
jgi:Spy/CpxP family protein refolding chaperone